MPDGPLRLLFDENLAARLGAAVLDLYPGSIHVSDVGLIGATDRAIWQHAQRHELVLVTKDQDFHNLAVFHGPPPKVIWIRLANCSTVEIAALLRSRRSEIEVFANDEEAACLALA